jgi:SynChlorMet cassette protein ScmC
LTNNLTHAAKQSYQAKFSSPAKSAAVSTVVHLVALSLVIAQETESDGGLLFHGALAERDGYGVILAGPGGVGKTTASQRLRTPWRSYSDDLTLVVRDDKGNYWAHPWPTWSDLTPDGSGLSWNVRHAVPLRCVFLLSQAQTERIDPTSAIEAFRLVTEVVLQASDAMTRRMSERNRRASRLKRFENICELIRDVPVYRLRLSRTGAFWHEIEQAMAENATEMS